MQSIEQNNYVICLKHGTKYSAEYVNKLYNMVKRNLTIPHTFVCFTENTKGLQAGIETRPLPTISGIEGWWYKPLFFNPNIGLEGNLLYLDLDIIIYDNIDKLFTYKPREFCIIRDFNRIRAREWKRMNSSVFRLTTGSQEHVFKEYITNYKNITRKFPGDQDYIQSQVTKDFNFWPDKWIQSYKWEMRGNPKTIRINGTKNFETPGEPTMTPGCSIAVFHGQPNPHDCVDPWVKKSWR